MSEYTLMVGHCVECLKELPDACIDAVVTDPPYGLGRQPDMAEVMRHWLNGDDYKHTSSRFMGVSWDSFVPGPSVWRECFRVLKPGGHLLSFFGSRTYDIGALAIRLAGFEVRDQIMWVYGSGFPKSLDVSKAIDKCNGEPDRLLKFTAWMRTTGLKAKQINDITNSSMGGHYLTAKSQPAIPTAAAWKVLRPHCGDVPEWVDQLVERIEAEREVIGKYDTPAQAAQWRATYCGSDARPAGDITIAKTGPAKQWQGWGTALKPAHEPIVVARKPIIRTVAANVLEHGTGAINVDGCRIDGERWPTNFIHDGSDEATQGLGKASRYFYCAKASKRDRDEGNNHPTVKPTDLMRYLVQIVTPPNGTVLDPFMGSGSTGKACMLGGFNFVGCELSQEYAEIAKARIEHAKNLKPEFKLQSELFDG